MEKDMQGSCHELLKVVYWYLCSCLEG